MVGVDYQILFNIAILVAGSLGGWVLGRITKALDQLDKDVRDLPKDYVLKSDFNATLLRIETVLERIDHKLDGKVDK